MCCCNAMRATKSKVLNKSKHYDGYLRLANVKYQDKKRIYLTQGRPCLDSVTMITLGVEHELKKRNE